MSSTLGETSSIRDQFARWLRWAGGSVAMALALAGCGGGEAVAPAVAVPAQAAPPADVVAQTAAQQAVDQRMALPRMGALASVKSGAASDDFESGMADWSNWGNTQVVAGSGTSGSSAMRVGTGAGGAGLAVPGIVAGTTYRFTAQVRVGNAAEKVDLGINMLDASGNKLTGGGSVTRGPATTDGWVPVTVDLVAPANAAFAVAWVWKNAGSDYGYVDDVVFGPAGAAPPPPSPDNMIANGGFESGMSEWSNWGNAQVVAGAGISGSKAMQVGTGAGGAGLTISGIVPGTRYRLTAQVRVTDPSEPAAIGFDLRSASGGLVIGLRSPQVTSTGYTAVTVDFVAPAGSASAVVWVWTNAGSGYAYVDDIAFGPGDAPPPPTAPPAGNLVTNGGFESGMTGWVNWGNASVVAGQASEGSSALAVGTGAGGAGQDIGGIVPGTIYRLLVQARVSDPAETVLVGVRFTDDWGNLQSQASGRTVSGTSYSAVTLDTTAPPNATRATVYVWKNAGSGFAYVDDYVFGVAPDSAPPPPPPPPSGNLVANGGFENGMASWVNWGNATAATGQAAAGSYAAQVGTGAGGFGQDVGGIGGGNTYRLSGSVKVDGVGETGYLGVKFMDDAGNGLLERSVPFRSTTYSTAQIDVAAPANATKALVYVWKNAGSGFAYADEVALAQLTAASPSPEQVSSPPSSQPYAAQLASGERIVVWTSGVNGQGDVFAQVFDANGMKVGAPVAVFAGQWKLNGVGALSDGSFLVAASGWRDSSGTLQTALYVQKVSPGGQLLASGGTSDAHVNGGLAGMLIAEDQATTIGFVDSSIFANADGSYVIAPVRVTRPVPLNALQRVLVNVAATGEVVGAPVEISNGYSAHPAPAITRLGGGNFLVAGTGAITYGPVVWKVLTSAGQVVAQRNLGAAPGNSTYDPRVTTLADGTGLLTWGHVNSVSQGWAAARIDGNGNVVGTVLPPTRAGAVTGLANGGWVQTWISGTQLMGQYFAVSGQPASDVFVAAENLDVNTNVPTYSVVATADGFVAVYTTATASGGRVDQIRFTAPSLN